MASGNTRQAKSKPFHKAPEIRKTDIIECPLRKPLQQSFSVHPHVSRFVRQYNMKLNRERTRWSALRSPILFFSARNSMRLKKTPPLPNQNLSSRLNVGILSLIAAHKNEDLPVCLFLSFSVVSSLHPLHPHFNQSCTKWRLRNQNFTVPSGPVAMNFAAAWMPANTKTTSS